MTSDNDTPYTLDDLPTIEKYLRIRTRFYQWQTDWEDCVQEGVIRAWKDIQTGGFTRAHVRNRAAQRSRAVATSGHHPMTGHPKSNTRTGAIYSDATLSPMHRKVSDFIDDYARANKGYMPSSREIIDATGADQQQLNNLLKSIKQRRERYTSAILDKEGRIDSKAYTHAPLVYNTSAFDQESNGETELAASVPSFEGDSIARMAYEDMLTELFEGDPDTVTAIQMFVMDGHRQRVVGEAIGVSQMQVSRMLKRAFAKIESYYAAEGIVK